MQGDGHSERPGVLERPPEHPARDDGFAVVGEPRRSSIGQLAHLGENLAGETARDRRQRPDRNHRLHRCAAEQRVEEGRLIEHRVGVRHREDGGVSPCGGGGRAGREVLLVLLSGRSQVYVGIDQTGQQKAAVGSDLAGVGGVQVGADRRDQSIPNVDVGDQIDPLGRIEDPDAAHDDLGRWSAGVGEPGRHHATSTRAAAVCGCATRS